MCGITGFYAYNQNAAATISKIEQSTQKLYLRGPDHGDFFKTDKIALGHRRLSIIDTSDAANQPMKDSSGRYVIVFNGEIFNFKQLATQHLQPKGQQLSTTSDTEVLLYLLIHYGNECLNWLNGFFAFAFYDMQTHTLIVARDRFGKKPLLYCEQEHGLAFASEMKSLLSWGIPKEIDFNVLQIYLQLNYIPQPYSMLKGVQKVEAGHYQVYANGKLEKNAPYYELNIHKEKYSRYSYDNAQQELITLMDASVKERMIADVPLGAFLSGGIDSSVIVALASRYTNKLNTFSIGYKDNPFFDETKYAKLVADKYKTNHTVFSLANDDFLHHIDDILAYIDEPFADSSAIPVYILCKETKKHVTVSLSGDGGDELFAGYNKHAAEWKMRQNSLAKQLVKAGYPLWKSLPKSRNNKITNLFRQLYRFADGAKLSKPERYWRWATFNDAGKANSLLSGESKRQVVLQKIAEIKNNYTDYVSGNDFNEVLLADMHLVLEGDMLVKVDLMSMANSLEVRSPFLDYKVADFAFSIPVEYKVDGSMKKKIVQDAFRHMLPKEIYNRPKHGFEIPLLGWFRKELWGMINDDLLNRNFVVQQGIFNAEAIEQLKTKLKSNNPEDSHATVWALLVFQHWWKQYLT